MRFRQQNAGIGEYEWSSSHDSRVRPSHRDFDGHIYSWQGSPQAPEGPPGWPIRCRCVALPVIDLDRIVTKPVPGSYITVSSSPDMMAHNRFKPSIAAAETKISVESTGDTPIQFSVHQVRNSEFHLYACTICKSNSTCTNFA